MSDQLAVSERARLAELEAVVERGFSAFVRVRSALLEIRDKRLYRAEHRTFEDYCRERWGLKRQRAYELIGAAGMVGRMSEIPTRRPPTRRRLRPWRRSGTN